MNKMNSFLIVVLLAVCLFIQVTLGGCAASKRAQLEPLKRCPERICAGDVWPGDYTNCTCKD
jgi:hypothetical protein